MHTCTIDDLEKSVNEDTNHKTESNEVGCNKAARLEITKQTLLISTGAGKSSQESKPEFEHLLRDEEKRGPLTSLDHDDFNKHVPVGCRKDLDCQQVRS